MTSRSIRWLPLLSALALCAVAPSDVDAQSPDAFWRREMAGLERALRDPAVSARVRRIWWELASETGQHYPVFPSQQFTLGQALPNGVVLLDLSVAGNAHPEVTAFWLAHEYAHQVLGHPSLFVSPLGRWITAMAGTSQEDAADRWAARFLERRGYHVEPVLAFLCELPSHPSDVAHSAGPTRAAVVARTYGSGAVAPCPSYGREMPTHSVGIRMWTVAEGDATTLDVLIDGEYAGSLSNLMHAGVLHLELSEGDHSFTLSDITLHGPRGPRAGGYRCSGTLRVQRSATFRVWVRLDPYGNVTCGFNG